MFSYLYRENNNKQSGHPQKVLISNKINNRSKKLIIPNLGSHGRSSKVSRVSWVSRVSKTVASHLLFIQQLFFTSFQDAVRSTASSSNHFQIHRHFQSITNQKPIKIKNSNSAWVYFGLSLQSIFYDIVKNFDFLIVFYVLEK